MAQNFQYSNLLSGTRSGEGWIRVGSGAGGGYNAGTGIELYNDGSSERSLYSPPVVLHPGSDYTLSCFAANTDNMKGTKWCVINKATGSLATYHVLDSPGPGGGYGSPSIFVFGTMQRTAVSTSYASTTRGPRTGKDAPYGSATSCSPRARSRTHGHRQRGRCGRR